MPQQKNLLRLTSVKLLNPLRKVLQRNEKQHQRNENQQLLIRALHLKELWQRNDLKQPVKQANQYRHL